MATRKNTKNGSKPVHAYSDSCTKVFSYWRFRTMYSIMLGYAAFYLVRQNFSFAIPSICSEFGYTKQDIGMVLTIGAVLYGVGKGLFGLLGDRYSARYIMVIGPLCPPL
jgi:sugar phosphate permease